MKHQTFLSSSTENEPHLNNSLFYALQQDRLLITEVYYLVSLIVIEIILKKYLCIS